MAGVDRAGAGPRVQPRRSPVRVDIPDLPEPSPALITRAQGGIYYLPGDRQIRWNGNIESDLSRNALLVTDRAGLDQAATVKCDYIRPSKR